MVGRRDQFGSELQKPNAFWVRLDDLNALSRDLQLPIRRLRLRIVFLQRRKSVPRRLQNLADQIFGQVEIVAGDRQQWPDIARPDGVEEIEPRTVLEKLGREARIGSEQDRVLPADDSGIEVRNGHRRRSDGRLAIDLGVMALVDLRIVAAQPDPADRKYTEAVSFCNTRFLQ